MIFVVKATREANRIILLLVKLVTNVVEKTISKMYANQDPRDQWIGHTRPGLRVDVLTDVIFMMLIAVRTAPSFVMIMAKP